MQTPAASLPKGSERMSTVDTAWLRMDSDVNRMMILGVWFLSPTVELAAVRQRVSERLLRFRRFKQRAVDDADGSSSGASGGPGAASVAGVSGARWVDDDQFDIAHHVVAESLKRTRGQPLERALQQRMAELAAEPLDARRPLWQLHLVEHYDGGSVLIARVHHCIADGMALIAVMLSITDGGRPPPKARKNAADSEPDWLADATFKPISEWTVKQIQEMHPLSPEASAQADAVLQAVADPLPTRAALDPGAPVSASPAEQLGAQVMNDLAALAFAPDDSPTRLKGRAGRDKRVAWGPGIPLDAVKAVAKSLNVSVNDVLLGCVAGAIGTYLREQGDRTEDQEIRALVPVNLRPLETAWQLGNRFGMVPLALPIGIANPVKRLYAVHARMQELKTGLRPVLAFGLLAAAGMLERPAQQSLLEVFARKATAIMTNVPGPTEALRFCGATVDRVMFWAPQAGDIGLGVSILSYAGQVQFGLITDAGLCPDPDRIVAHFEPEFQRLLTLALMLPWAAEEGG